MKYFFYKALTTGGESKEGRVEAESLVEAQQILAKDYYAVFEIKELGVAKTFATRGMFTPKIKGSAIVVFMRQLKSLYEAGIPLKDCLSSIKLMHPNKQFHDILEQIIQGLEGGESFSFGLSAFPDVFSESLVAMVKAGEASGSLGKILDEQSQLLEWEEKITKSVKGALRYPLMVITAAFGALFFIVTFILPKFTVFYASQGDKLPLVTRILMAINHFILGYWWQNLIAVGSIIFGTSLLLQTKIGKETFDKLFLKIPLFGGVYIKYATARFSKIFAITYQNGVDVVHSLEIASHLFESTVYRKEIEHIITELKEGLPMGAAFERSDFFPALAKQMIQSGEKSGSLGEMMKRLGEFYTIEVQNTVDNFFAYLEPVLIIFIGCMVLVLALGIFLPMWNMMSMVN